MASTAKANRHAKLIIIGSGPAGYTAAIYAARAMLKPLLIEGIHAGGQMTTTTDVENYPGFRRGDPGALAHGADEAPGRACRHRDRSATISRGRSQAAPFRLKGDSGTEYTADALIIATGAQARWLGLPSEQQFQGLRRLGLRHLRRLLLPQQAGHRGRRRQHRGRGGAVPRQYRQRGDAGASPRRAPRREDPAGAPVQEPEDRDHVEHRARRGARARRPARRDRRQAQEHARPARSRARRSTACSSPSATRRRANCSRASSR